MSKYYLYKAKKLPNYGFFKYVVANCVEKDP